MLTQKNVLYLAVWASKFLAFSNKRGQTDIDLTVAEFIESLEARKEMKDWQVRQAREAVRLYLNHFKGGEALKALSGKERPEGRLSDRPKLLAEMKRLIRLKHLAYNTELAYLDWVERYFTYLREYDKWQPLPRSFCLRLFRNFLSHLAIDKQVSSSTQNQALCALVFLFRDVLGQELGDISGMVWAKRGKKAACGAVGR